MKNRCRHGEEFEYCRCCKFLEFMKCHKKNNGCPIPREIRMLIFDAIVILKKFSFRGALLDESGIDPEVELAEGQFYGIMLDENGPFKISADCTDEEFVGLLAGFVLTLGYFTQWYHHIPPELAGRTKLDIDLETCPFENAELIFTSLLTLETPEDGGGFLLFVYILMKNQVEFMRGFATGMRIQEQFPMIVVNEENKVTRFRTFPRDGCECMICTGNNLELNAIPQEDILEVQVHGV